jgi:hypothetical protein
LTSLFKSSDKEFSFKGKDQTIIQERKRTFIPRDFN